MFDLIIIGGGPAGLSAAIYGSRANLKVGIIEPLSLGGKLIKIDKIENYPSFEEITGFELSDKLASHTNSFKPEIINAEVKSINEHFITLDDGKEIEAKAIIIASGSKEKELDLEKANDYIGKGISYCAVCDGFFYRKKDIVIVGGGNSALQEALYLSNIVNSITIIIRRDEFRADATLVDKISQDPKIKVIKNVLPYKLLISDDKISGLQVKNKLDDSIMDIECQGIFPYLGSLPNTSFVPSSILDEYGCVVVDEDMKTSIPYIFGAGDVTNTHLRQIITACGDGARAATSVIKYLNK